MEIGSVMSVEGEAFRISNNEGLIRTVPMNSIEGAVIFGGTQVTTKAIAELLQRDIPTTFVSNSGRYYGRLLSTETKGAKTKLAQIKKSEDRGFCARTAHACIKGKILNSVYILSNLNRSRFIPAAKQALEALYGILRSMNSARDVESIRGFEGSAAAVYYHALPYVLKESFGFKNRNRRPPKDPINSMLSFSYTLLMYHVYNAVVLAGLDPSFGFFHSVADNRPALALDLMEEFRPLISDQVVFDMVNHDMVKQDSFHESDEGDYPVLMNNDLRKKFIQRFEKRVSTVVLYEGDKISYRRVFEMQAKKMARCIKGTCDYEAFIQK